ncbi:fumarylacetoacetate hydrolase family protein [Jatrophihabitans fulvus]
MTTTFVRYRSAAADEDPRWGLLQDGSVLPLPADVRATADVLADPSAAADAARSASDPPVTTDRVSLLSPTPGARVVCQGANYRSHMVESGMDPDRAFNMLFTKSTASLSGPYDDIVRPAHVRLLDYEVELGIVLRAPITGPTRVTDATLPDHVGAFVVANDVSARDVQLPQGQWYKGKSYRTFCPVGPYLVVPDRDEVARWSQLRLRLTVNGEERQNGLAGDMVFGPAATLTELSHLEDLAAGDLLLTGTPGGVALQPPPAAVQRIAGLLPEARRWQLFVKGQSRSNAYLRPGDVVEASIRTDDGDIDLGTQRTTVR